MAKDLTLGQYFPGDSFIHNLDPRTKIISVLAYVGVIFLATNYWGYFILSLFVALLILLARIPLRVVLKSVKPLWFILSFTIILHIFATPGLVIFEVGPLVATAEGLIRGFFMALRLCLLIIVASLLIFTTSPIALTDAMERILSPLRKIGVPAHELAMMMTIALRFIPTILEETDRIVKAQIVRGADFSTGNYFKRAKNMIPLLVPLFISAFRRADDLALAMEARCYRGGENRTRMRQLSLGQNDIIAITVFVFLIIILIVLRSNIFYVV